MLKKGTYIKAKLIEAVEEDYWIVSFQGQLLQVKNNTNIEFKAGLILQLQVVKQSPLSLRILQNQSASSLKIDIHV